MVRTRTGGRHPSSKPKQSGGSSLAPLTHPTDGCRRGKLEVVGLENEIDVAPEVYSLPVGQSKQVVVVQDGIEGLDPLGVDVPVTNQPRLHLRSNWRVHEMFRSADVLEDSFPRV